MFLFIVVAFGHTYKWGVFDYMSLNYLCTINRKILTNVPITFDLKSELMLCILFHFHILSLSFFVLIQPNSRWVGSHGIRAISILDLQAHWSSFVHSSLILQSCKIHYLFSPTRRSHILSKMTIFSPGSNKLCSLFVDSNLKIIFMEQFLYLSSFQMLMV